MSAAAIMQPYAFPYLGYFSLARASNVFVFYDDVNYIPRGWINRNRLLVNGLPQTFTFPLSRASQNRPIRDIPLHDYPTFRARFLKHLAHTYKKAPCFGSGLAYVEEVLNPAHERISELAINSVVLLFRRLGRGPAFMRSSSAFADSAGSGRSARLIAITKSLGARQYINPISGMALYDRQEFAEHGLGLSFLRPALQAYPQVGTRAFVPGLSIIDVLMHNDIDAVGAMLDNYELH